MSADTSAAAIYAGSLYDLAAEENLTDQILEQMAAVRTLFSENPAYVPLLLEPSIPKKTRTALVDDAFKGSLHPYLLSFIKLLLENGLLRSFNECCRVFRMRYNKDQGISEATVTSAVELSEKQIEALKEKLEARSGKKVHLTMKVDPDILGGVSVDLDGVRLDGSVAGRLSGIRKKIDSTVV